ncbi:MAG: SurA N-terminal domain-containing protein [Acidobacteriota bacterium]
MLKVFRDNLKYLSWVLWIVVAVFILFVFVDYGSAGRAIGGNANWAARVGNEEVSFDEFRYAHRSLEQRFRQAYGEQFTAELATQLQLPQQALQQVVDRKIMLLEAEALGIHVSDEEVRDAIYEMPWLQDDQGNFVGKEEYRKFLERRRQPADAFEKDIREGLKLDRLTDVLTASLYIPDEQVERSYREQIERAAIRFVQLPAASLQDEAKATREELKVYLEENPEDFHLPERRKIAFLLVDNGRVRNEVVVDDAEVREYYDANPDEFTQEEQVQARHILVRTTDELDLEGAKAKLAEARARIEAGEGFAQVAGDVSDDPGSAGRGGHLGFFGRGRMTPEFEKAAFEAPVGELIGPIETPFGVHLLEVTGKLPDGLQEFERVEARIRSRLLSERVVSATEEKANAVAEQLQVGSTVTVEQLQELTETEDAISLNQPDPFGQEDLIPGLGRAPEFSNEVFSIEAGTLGQPIKVPRGYALPLVLEVMEPRAPQLSEVEAKVRQAAERANRQQLAMDRIAAAKADIDAGTKTFDQVAEELELTIEESGEFGGGGAIQGLGFSPRISEAAMSLDQGAIAGPYGTTQGAVLFEVTERTQYDPTAFAEAKEQTRRSVEGQELQRLLVSLLQQRRLELDVSYSRRVQDMITQSNEGTPAAG